MIKKPRDRGPLFGGGVQIMIGGSLAHQLRKWKKHQAAASNNEEED
ncbi:MAG: hypothetical protein V4499_02460 [Pseudomonadota bacterium]